MPRTRRKIAEDKISCFLCKEMTAKKKMADWELLWLQRCSESLSQLLDVECFSSAVFEAGAYCSTCMDRLRDVDFTLRTTTSLQSRLFELRSQIAEFLLSGIDLSADSEVTATQGSFSDCVPLPILASSPCVETNSQGSSGQILHIGDPNAIERENQDMKVFFEIKQDSGTPSTTRVEHDTIENNLTSDSMENTADEDPLPIQTRTRRSTMKTVIYHEDEDSNDYYADTQEELGDEYLPVREVNSLTNRNPSKVPNKQRGRKRRATSSSNPTKALKGDTVDSDSSLVQTLDRTAKQKKPNWNAWSETSFMKRINFGGYWKKSEEELESIISEYAQTLFPTETLTQVVNEDETQLDLITFLIRTELAENYQSTKTFICTFPFCPARFSHLDRLRTHKLKDHGEYIDVEPFECPWCKFRCNTEPFLNGHIRRTHENDPKPHHCEVSGCFKTFTQSTLLIRHMRLWHAKIPTDMGESRKPYFEYRDKEAMSKKEYVNQRLAKSKCRRFFFCSEESCPFSSTTKQNILFHRLQIHEKRPSPFPCDQCGKDFRQREGYNNHPCVKKRNHQCEYCGRNFKSQYEMTQHQKIMHKDAVGFRCSVCDRCYFRPEEVERHEKLHTPETGFNCVIFQCSDPYFETKEALRQHVGGPSHDMTQKTRCCDICGYVASGHRAAGLLKQHMLIHTGEARHKCRFCDKRLKTRATLKQHEEVNHQDLIEKRVYACKLCDATFTVAQYLFKHNAWHKYGSNACRPIAKKKIT